MSEIVSLYELNQIIKSVIDTALSRTFLVTAEIASLDIKNHCWMTLLDKDKDTIRAEMKAVIWGERYRALSRDFTKATGVELSKGIRILFEAEVDFHERYGLKLNILNIDPSYTIGELAVKRKEILERLAREGLRDRNKSLELPSVPQKIGIISSSSAAGYEDLMNHLLHNPFGYQFSCRLYESVMQGDKAEASIISALKQCGKDASSLDIVVIVRGGGGQTDLHCFDSYEIARTIAFLPLPVISGIGHERDITVVDEVSHSRVKTPTAAADLIITRTKNFEDSIDASAHNLVHGASRLTADLKAALSRLTKNLEAAVRKDWLNNKHMLDTFIRGLRYAIKLVDSERERLASKEGNIYHLTPANVLKRGYSITCKNGRPVKSVTEVDVGDCVATTLFTGTFVSRVEDKKNKGGIHE